MDSQARCLLAADAAKLCALATEKISSLVSFTPIIGVTAIFNQTTSSLHPASAGRLEHRERVDGAASIT